METVNENNDFISDIFHDGASPLPTSRQARTMKIPLNPPEAVKKFRRKGD